MKKLTNDTMKNMKKTIMHEKNMKRVKSTINMKNQKKSMTNEDMQKVVTSHHHEALEQRSRL